VEVFEFRVLGSKLGQRKHIALEVDRMADPTIQQWCPDCRRIVTATLYLEWKNHMKIADKSVCPCGLVLWNWRWEQGHTLTKEGPKKGEQLKLF